MQPAAVLLICVWRGLPDSPQNAPLAQYLGDVSHNVKERVVLRMYVTTELTLEVVRALNQLMRDRFARVCCDLPTVITRRAACSAANAMPRCSPALLRACASEVRPKHHSPRSTAEKCADRA